jgi:hypothetical protein
MAGPTCHRMRPIRKAIPRLRVEDLGTWPKINVTNNTEYKIHHIPFHALRTLPRIRPRATLSLSHRLQVPGSWLYHWPRGARISETSKGKPRVLTGSSTLTYLTRLVRRLRLTQWKRRKFEKFNPREGTINTRLSSTSRIARQPLIRLRKRSLSVREKNDPFQNKAVQSSSGRRKVQIPLLVTWGLH